MKLKLLSFVQKLLEWSIRAILKIHQQNNLVDPPTVPTAYPSGVAVFDGINTYFINGTVIKDISNGKIYLVVNSKKQHITSPDVFTKFGIDIDSILLVSHKEAELHKDGEPIS